jgi:hypothetical protein
VERGRGPHVAAPVAARDLMTGEERCRCGHRLGEHTLTGECAIERYPSIEGFKEATQKGYSAKQPCGCIVFTLALDPRDVFRYF